MRKPSHDFIKEMRKLYFAKRSKQKHVRRDKDGSEYIVTPTMISIYRHHKEATK